MRVLRLFDVDVDVVVDVHDVVFGSVVNVVTCSCECDCDVHVGCDVVDACGDVEVDLSVVEVIVTVNVMCGCVM